METFHFLRPWWLLGLVALMIVTPWVWRRIATGGGWQQVIASHLQPALLGTQRATSSRWKPFLIFAAAWIIACLSLAGPAWEQAPSPVYHNERAIVVVMDMSMNTRAADISPDRLTRLRFKAVDLVNALQQAQIGLIAYAGDAYAISPLTNDQQNIRAMLPALSPEIMPVAGNYPLLAMREADRMLTDSGYSQGEIYWFSAGMNQDDLQELSNFFRNRPHRLSAIIAGDEQATPIRLSSGDMLRDTLGRIEMAQLNPSLFERITAQTGGITVQVEASNRDVEQLLAQGPHDEQAGSEAEGLSADQWIDRGPYLAWLLVPLALLVARRGVLVAVVLVPVMLFPPVPVEAAVDRPERQTSTLGAIQSAAQNAFKNRQQQASEAYQAGDYLSAVELATDPMLRGNAWYRAENFSAALDAYQSADASPERWYNSGNSLAQLGMYEEAIEAYEHALEARPEWPEALQNKALIERLLEQQEQNNEQEQRGDQQQSADQPPEQSEQEGDNDEPDNNQTQDQSAPSDEQQGSEQEQETAEESGSQEEQEAQAETDAEPEPTDGSAEQPLDGAQSSLAQDDLTDEERAELEQLLRRLESDPATLLRNRMRLEAERRRYN